MLDYIKYLVVPLKVTIAKRRDSHKDHDMYVYYKVDMTLEYYPQEICHCII